MATKLSEIVTRVETLLTITVGNFVAVKAYNDFCSMIERAEGQRYAHRHRKSVVVSLSDSGYDLSGISNLRNADDGFEVFTLNTGETFARSENKLDRIPQGIQLQKGFWIHEGKLYSNIFNMFGVQSPQNVLILYMAKTTREDYATAPNTITLTMDQDCELAFENYMSMLYHQGKYQPAKIAEAQQWAKGWLDDYFSTVSKS